MRFLLVASIVRHEHDRGSGGLAIVGHVEEIADLIEQPLLALLDRDVLPDHDHAVGLPTGRRRRDPKGFFPSF